MVVIVVAAHDASPQQADASGRAPEVRTFDGRVIGPDNEAVSGLVVLLHRVTNQGGAQLARSVTAEDGQFSLQYEPPRDAEGVYFVVARYDGRAYIGPMLRAPFAEAEDYVMQVGVPGVGDVESLMRRSSPPSAATSVGAGALAGRPPASGGVFVAVILSAAIAIGAVFIIRGTGPSPRRRALIELAGMDEAGPGGASATALARRRRELLRRAREA